MRCILVLLLLLSSYLVVGQEEPITASKDSSTHSIRTATLLSTFIPGAGQVYNSIHRPKGKRKAYWKVPLYLGAIGYMGYSLWSNQSTVNAIRSEYNSRQAGNASGEDWVFFDDQGLITLESQFSSSRDMIPY